ncbi:hypothetical protein SKAU_G00419600 [Synaphobranchus kaupii]|uniref:ornithine decarboxylase n=1 Tax=Synaphobranchus kaupii TaxID=118154 RepID=A0A9Q1E6D5_SYNKA|nr:hypothetical protein SKAU_G00419600 [Synaphobranchus kaupii]
MNTFTPADFDFTLLEEGFCAHDIIEQRMKELSMSTFADLFILRLVLRITTDDSKMVFRLSVKFGATLKSCRLLLERAGELGLNNIGVSFHVGSGYTDPETYTQAISDARCVFDMGELGYNMTLLDIGGGFPGFDDSKLKFEDVIISLLSLSSYTKTFLARLKWVQFTAVINPALDKYFPADSEVRVIAEPGRYYVSSAYTLAVNIIGKKVVMKEQLTCGDSTSFISHSSNTPTDEDDGANDRTLMYYVNDGIYSSFNEVLFDPAYGLPRLHKKPKPDERMYPCSIWGQTCDGLDRIVEQCVQPDLQVSEWLLFKHMGAYSVTLSTTFNGFHKPDVHYVMSRSAWYMPYVFCHVFTDL